MSKQLDHAPGAYDTDFYEWCLETAALIRGRRFDEVDLEHVAEEIEDMGKRDKREVQSRLITLIMHLLKWQFQPNPEFMCSWRATIREQRSQGHFVLKDSPSLVRLARREIPEVYPRARREAIEETGLPAGTFPETCPFTAEQILDEDFFPA
jgi:Domain of unknown function DUF29